MHDLRFPEDATEVIAELDMDAITKIKLYFAEKHRKQHRVQGKARPG